MDQPTGQDMTGDAKTTLTVFDGPDSGLTTLEAVA